MNGYKQTYLRQKRAILPHTSGARRLVENLIKRVEKLSDRATKAEVDSVTALGVKHHCHNVDQQENS